MKRTVYHREEKWTEIRMRHYCLEVNVYELGYFVIKFVAISSVLEGKIPV